MHPPKGYAGKILKTDLSSRTAYTVSSDDYSGRFLGGRGIAAKIYYDEVPPEAGAFDPENRLIIMLGPLAGIPALGGSRWGIFAKSPRPEGDRFCCGNLGGYFGAELKFAGYDGLVVAGRADGPVILVVDGDKVSVEPADELWGLSTVETMETLTHGRYPKSRVLAVGPAGENLVRFATVFADGDASCSGGMGAVMGSKNLKAVVVRGKRKKIETADPESLKKIETDIRASGRGNVKVWGMDFMAHGPKTKKFPCYGCMAHCLRVKYRADNGVSGKFMCQSRFFYMNHAWGYYGEDNDVPFLANRMCDEYGVDTWELQAVIEWLLRCHAEGLITEKESGLDLDEVGSLEFIETLIRSIIRRKGFGELLSRGAEAAADELGDDFRRQFVRNDPYDPRYCTPNILLFPFETREPIQQLHEAGLVLSQWSSWAKGVEEAHISSDVVRGIAERFWGGREAADMTTYAGKAEAARRIQDRQLAKESLGICDWMYPAIDVPNSGDHVGDPSIESRILHAATGLEYGEEEYYRIGERVFNLQRALLLREGHRPRRDDYLPREWHEHPLETHVADPECLVPGPGGKPISMIGHRIDRGDYEKLLDEFYGLRGWDVPTGLQSRRLLEDLDMADVAAGLEKARLLVTRPRGVPLGVRFARGVRRICRGAAGGTGDPGSFEAADGPSIRGEELTALLEEQREKFSDPAIARNFRGWNKAMQYYFPDIDEYHVIFIEDGEARPPEKLDEPIKNPEIHYEMSTGALLAMTRGELSGFQAYQQRKLKIRAAFGDMMKLQALNKS